jgi:hypothetical protein
MAANLVSFLPIFLEKRMRFYMFLDESGDASTNPDPRYNVFVLCGVLFREDHYATFDNELKNVKIKIFNDPDVVFHSYEMRKQTGPFRVFKDKAVLMSFYDEIGKILTKQNYTIIACIVNKAAYSKKYPDKNQVYEDALMFICERAISFVGKKSNNTIHFCLEKRGNKDRLLKSYYTDFVKYGTEYYSTADFKRCHPQLYFRGKDKHVNGLELADLCAFPIGIKELHPDREQKTYDLIKNKFSKSFWGKIEGIGLKRFP